MFNKIFSFYKIFFPIYSHEIRNLYSENITVDETSKFNLKDIRKKSWYAGVILEGFQSWECYKILKVPLILLFSHVFPKSFPVFSDFILRKKQNLVLFCPLWFFIDQQTWIIMSKRDKLSNFRLRKPVNLDQTFL